MRNVFLTVKGIQTILMVGPDRALIDSGTISKYPIIGM